MTTEENDQPGTMALNRELEEMLIRHEGLRLKPYRCTAGKLTIGVGRNLDDNGISKMEAMLMLRHDIAGVQAGLHALPWFAGLSQRRRNVLINMAFNLGLSGLFKFKRMLAAMEQGDFDQAAREMLDSSWASQVHGRSEELARMMREG